MALWEATRATSAFITSSYGAVQATVGSGNSYDVVSASPDTTTCMSFCPGSVSAGTGQIIWKSWQVPTYTPDSWYNMNLYISCKSMGTQYFSFDYSVDSGENWTNFISSVGGSNLSATTIVRSIAKTISVRSLWIRLNTTNAHRRSRAQIWDLSLVGSYATTFNNYVADNFGISDYTVSSIVGAPQSYERYPYNPVDMTDSAYRSMIIRRNVVDG